MRTMIDYCEISGQDVSLDKSCVQFSPKLHHRHVRRVATMLGVLVNRGVWTHLGVPIMRKRLQAC